MERLPYADFRLEPADDVAIDEGFPIDFTTALWNGSSKNPVITRIGFAKPGTNGHTEIESRLHSKHEPATTVS
jgi:hypothetical protein